MYLKSITINNYRSIQKARVDFEDGLNIIIGKNGAGKSNLLKYIYEYVSSDLETLIDKIQNNKVEFEYCFCFDDDESIVEFTVNIKTERIIFNNGVNFHYQGLISKKVNEYYTYADKYFDLPVPYYPKRRTENDEYLISEFDKLRRLRKKFVAFEIPDNKDWLSNAVKYQLDTMCYLESDNINNGFSLLQVLQEGIMVVNFQTVANKEQSIVELDDRTVRNVFLQSFTNLKEKFDLDNILKKYSPITELRLNPNINTYHADNKILIENLIIEFRVNNSWVPWGYLSDGTKRLFYIITETLCLEDGLLLIEEPELGIHPHQLFSLMQFLKEQSAHKQIILSTHSPMVLDVLSPIELDRINIAKLTPTGSAFSRLTDEQKEKARQYIEEVGELSQYWLHSDLEDE